MQKEIERQIHFACAENGIRTTWSSPKSKESIVIENFRGDSYFVTFLMDGSVYSASSRSLSEAAEDVLNWLNAGCRFPY